jgi:hypothetical protein
MPSVTIASRTCCGVTASANRAVTACSRFARADAASASRCTWRRRSKSCEIKIATMKKSATPAPWSPFAGMKSCRGGV